MQSAVAVAALSLTAVSFIQFKPESFIPFDEKVAPFARYLGYSLLGLAAYEGWRTYMRVKHK